MKTIGSRIRDLSFVLVFFLFGSLLGGRTWSTANGAQTEGELLSIEGEQVTLLIEGREYVFPITRFSAFDRDYLMKWKREDRCAKCAIIVEGKKMRAGEQVFHPACFSCLVCQRPFMDRQSIRRDEWGGMVHSEHFRQAGSCGSCGRMFSMEAASKEQFFSDGRISCRVCLGEAVTDVATLDAVARRVRRGISELGIPFPSGSLTLRLVNQDHLDKELGRSHGRKSSLRGLTLTTFRTTTNGNDAQTTYTHEVWILFGLPVVECVSVLAHEFGHVWMNENHLDASPPAVEGFCNLLSMRLLKKETSKLAEVLRRNLQMSDDHVYGRGFRKMQIKLEKLGWDGLIRDLSARRLPLNKGN